MVKPARLWVRCPDCEDWYCWFHGAHVYECECPDMETLLEQGIDPYLPGSMRQYAKTHKHERKKP